MRQRSSRRSKSSWCTFLLVPRAVVGRVSQFALAPTSKRFMEWNVPRSIRRGGKASSLVVVGMETSPSCVVLAPYAMRFRVNMKPRLSCVPNDVGL